MIINILNENAAMSASLTCPFSSSIFFILAYVYSIYIKRVHKDFRMSFWKEMRGFI